MTHLVWLSTCPQIDSLQSGGTLLWALTSKTCPRIIRSKICLFRISNISATRSQLSSFSAQSLKRYGHCSDLGVEKALCHRHVEKRWFIRMKQVHQSTASQRTSRRTVHMPSADEIRISLYQEGQCNNQEIRDGELMIGRCWASVVDL